MAAAVGRASAILPRPMAAGVPKVATSHMNVAQFQQKWRRANLKEKSAAQEHFIDLCRLLGVQTPAEADPNGAFFTFEAGAGKAGGGDGFADVLFRGHFAWEYKGKHADLEAAYKQVLLYKDALQNPPLLVVCDLIRFVVKTNFTGTVTETYEFTIDDLSDPVYLGVLRNAFTDPERLRPAHHTAAVTEKAAERFGQLALDLTARGHDPAAVAHFLVQVLFCLVAEDMGLLERGLFTDLLAFGAKKPDRFPAQAAALFAAMRDGGDFDLKEVPRFNGGLFAAIDPLAFTAEELRSLAEDATADWSQLEPSIFGTLFERSLDPARRSQLGAHDTGREDILRVVEPVVLAPLLPQRERGWGEGRSPSAGKAPPSAIGRRVGHNRTRRRGHRADAVVGIHPATQPRRRIARDRRRIREGQTRPDHRVVQVHAGAVAVARVSADRAGPAHLDRPIRAEDASPGAVGAIPGNHARPGHHDGRLIRREHPRPAGAVHSALPRLAVPDR
ncbi:MAG: type IIL restriction-modification enzyme MmeI [Thermomicrobiales bacterium]